MVQAHTLFTDFDIALYQSGKHFRLYEKMGSHCIEINNRKGTYFAVWAPNAKRVSITGDFNGWNPDTHVLLPRWDKSGIWEGFVPGIGHGTVYKYHITMHNGAALIKVTHLPADGKPRPALRVWFGINLMIGKIRTG